MFTNREVIIFKQQKEQEFQQTIYKLFNLRNIYDIKMKWWYATHQIKYTNNHWNIIDVDIDNDNTLPIYPTDLECYNYKLKQSQWVADQILNKYGWEHFVYTCLDYKIDEYIYCHTPCEDNNINCVDWCIHKKNCDKKLI